MKLKYSIKLYAVSISLAAGKGLKETKFPTVQNFSRISAQSLFLILWKYYIVIKNYQAIRKPKIASQLSSCGSLGIEYGQEHDQQEFSLNGSAFLFSWWIQLIKILPGPTADVADSLLNITVTEWWNQLKWRCRHEISPSVSYVLDLNMIHHGEK